MSSEGDFIVPPPFGEVGNYSDLPSYGIDTTVKLEWTTSEQDTRLWLLQDGDGLSCPELNKALISCQLLLSGNRGQSWDWVVTEPENYTTSVAVYYLSMRNSSDDGLFTSHYFNLLPENLLPAISSSSSESASTATSTSVTSSLPAQTISTSAATITTASGATIATASAAPPQTASPGLDSSTKTAIGVAVGVGIPVVAILAVIAFFLYRNYKRKNARPSPENFTNSAGARPSEYPYRDSAIASKHETSLHWSKQAQVSQEMSGDNRYHESPYRPPAELS